MKDSSKLNKSYAIMYHMTAVIHLLYALIFYVAKCNFFVMINFIFALIYVGLGLSVRKANEYKDIFVTCGVVMSLFIVFHYVFLGPSYGFQYLCFGAIPLIFLLAYVHGGNIKTAKWISVGIFLLFYVISVLCSFLHYPIFEIPLVAKNLLSCLNIFVAFAMCIQFMISFVVRATSETGTLMDQNLGLEETANLDALTGLRNRRSIEAYITRAFNRARGEGKDFTLLMCDIDNFKKVNDTYGHDCGDQVLKNIATIIKGEVRPEDVVFRWGGEEIFLIINAGHYVAKGVAERCRSSIEASSVMYNGLEIKVTITIGGASYYQGATRDDLINKADSNLYTGKNSGKNQVVM